MELVTSLFGLVVVLLGLLVVVIWVLFPFFVLSRLKEQQRTLDRIAELALETARHTKSQADFWRDRNVRID